MIKQIFNFNNEERNVIFCFSLVVFLSISFFTIKTCLSDVENEAKIRQVETKIANSENKKTENFKNEKSEKININQASLEELKTLPCIGNKKANQIIEYREKHKGFKSIDEIKKIKGIGPKTFEKLKNFIICN